MARTLVRVSYGDGGAAGAVITFDMLMGKEVPPRRKFIEENAEMADVDV